MNQYIITVGSNIAPQENVAKAFALIQNIDHQALSAPQLHTKAIGANTVGQADYINTAFLLNSKQLPQQFKQTLQTIEVELGRIRCQNKNAARPIDLDIVVVNGEIIDDDYHHYDFVKNNQH